MQNSSQSEWKKLITEKTKQWVEFRYGQGRLELRILRIIIISNNYLVQMLLSSMNHLLKAFSSVKVLILWYVRLVRVLLCRFKESPSFESNSSSLRLESRLTIGDDRLLNIFWFSITFTTDGGGGSPSPEPNLQTHHSQLKTISPARENADRKWKHGL